MFRKMLVEKLRDNRGAAMIEAALVLPVFFLLLFTALEFGMIMFYSFVLESAMFDATRLAKVSDDSAGTIDAIRKAVQERSFGLIPPEDIVITTELNTNMAQDWQNAPPEQCTDAAGVPQANSFCPCSGGGWVDKNGDGKCNVGPPPVVLEAPGNLVNFLVFYKKPLYSPLVSFAANISGREHLISAAVVIRNEP
jgi:hypothetical protein